MTDAELSAYTLMAAAAQKEDVGRVQDVPAKVAPKRSTLRHKRRDVHPVIRSQDVTRRSTHKPPQPVRSAQAQVPASLSAESQWGPRSH